MDPENMTTQFPVTETTYWNNHTMLFKPVFNMVISPIAVVMSICGLIGNSLVVWYLSFKIKRNTCTVYIFNLAVADALFMLFMTVLLFLGLILSLTPQLSAYYEDVDIIRMIHALNIACILGYNTSLCFLTAISIERCISALFPLWYYCNRPKHLSAVMCTIIWMISCTLSVLEAFYCYNTAYNAKHQSEEASKACKAVFIIICCFSFMFIPSMIVSSLILLIKVWTSSLQQRSMKLYVVITVTVVFFLVFGMPMRIFLLVLYKHHINIMPSYTIMSMFDLFCAINSTINPFVYFLVGRQGKSGKTTLLAVFQAVFRDDASQYKRQQRNIAQQETII